MAEADFEVMPRGTIEEVRAMRKFANEIIAIATQYDMIVPTGLMEKIHEMKSFYANHIQKYPV